MLKAIRGICGSVLVTILRFCNKIGDWIKDKLDELNQIPAIKDTL
jgi:hypothetical protein